ncbi:hypothetical protein, partial [Idiomarina xiamenensis]
MKESTYKKHIISLFILYLFYYNLPFLWPFIYSQETQAFLEYSGTRSLIGISGIFVYLIPAMYLAICCGLYFFSLYAKWIFTVWVLSNAIFGSVLFGYSASAYIDTSLGYIIALLEGAVLTIIHFSATSKRFLDSTNHSNT